MEPFKYNKETNVSTLEMLNRMSRDYYTNTMMKKRKSNIEKYKYHIK